MRRQVFPVVCGSHHDVCFLSLVFLLVLHVYTECVTGRFGADCQQRCECENGGQCDRQTGRCSCSAGWIGERCERGEPLLTSTYRNCDIMGSAARWKLLDWQYCVFSLIITSDL